MQQCRPTSVAIATGKVLRVLHMQQLMPGSVAFTTTTLPESVALATVLAFECGKCNSVAFKLLQMPQYNRRTVAFATVLRIFAAGKPPAARRAEKRPGRPYLISYEMLLYVTEYYGSVTKPQNPLTKKKRRGKVASQEKAEPPGGPSTDTGTASHGMCAR